MIGYRSHDRILGDSLVCLRSASSAAEVLYKQLYAVSCRGVCVCVCEKLKCYRGSKIFESLRG